MRRVTLPLALAVVWALCGPGTLARAQIYRWEDAQGRLHFSNEPPPAGAKSVGTIDTSRGKSPAEERVGSEEPAPPQRAERQAGMTYPDPSEPTTIRVADSGLALTLNVPRTCTRRSATGDDPKALAMFDCGQPGEARQGALSILMDREIRMTPAEFESTCRKGSEMPRVGAPLLSSPMLVYMAYCDRQRAELKFEGRPIVEHDLAHVAFVVVPTTEGLLGVVSEWRDDTRSSTYGALQNANNSVSVPAQYLVGAQKRPSHPQPTSSSAGHQNAPDRPHRPQAPNLESPIGLVFFLLGAAGAFNLYRIVRSEELGARLRGPR